ncbi:MAG: succinate dehydrogenase, cytochrome b556 subunit [Steroidobacteraceae bacterium]
MPRLARPLSPHLQVYRWQMGNTLSILHRLTGVALSLALLVLAYWLISLAGGAERYAAAMRTLSSPVGILFEIGWVFAFYYHLLNGVRHLAWDAGYGFERTQRSVSGWLAVFGALALSACTCFFIWRGMRA